MTNFFLLITIGVSLLSFRNERITQKLIFNPYTIHNRNQWYRFFSSGLIHADFMHLLINMLVLFSFGGIVAFEMTRQLKEQGKTVSLTALLDSYVDSSYYYKSYLQKILVRYYDLTYKRLDYLMEMLTSEPNFVKHYNHIGFQSYFVHPRMLETMDKLRFDCYRVGMAKESIEEMEPVIRNTNLLSFDISAIKWSDAPANNSSPNGFTGEEACMLTRFAGMSTALSSMGIYGYDPADDINELTAKQISQMLWYFIDGKSRSKQEAIPEDKHNFNEYHTAFTDIDTTFLQSKKTGRWWMQLPDKKLIACSYKDYINASNNEIPERWLRAQERQ